MSSHPILVKLTRPPGGLTRKVAFDTRPSWDALAARIQSLYGVPDEHVAVSYIDDEGDEVTMNTETELQDFYNTQPGSTALRFVVRDMRVAHDGPADTTSPGSARGRGGAASQLVESVADVIASLSGMGGANADVVDGIRNIARSMHTGGAPRSFPVESYLPPPLAPFPPRAFGHQPPLGRGTRGRHRHHGPPGAPHPRHESPPPSPGTSASAPPSGDDAFASDSPWGTSFANSWRRHYCPPPPGARFPPMAPSPPGAWPAPSGPPPGPEEFVHVSPHSEDAPRSSGAAPPPEAGPRSPGAAERSDERRSRGYGSGRFPHGPGPAGTPFDPFDNMRPDFARIFGSNRFEYGTNTGGWGDSAASWMPRASFPHARASRAWEDDVQRSTESEWGAKR